MIGTSPFPLQAQARAPGSALGSLRVSESYTLSCMRTKPGCGTKMCATRVRRCHEGLGKAAQAFRFPDVLYLCFSIYRSPGIWTHPKRAMLISPCGLRLCNVDYHQGLRTFSHKRAVGNGLPSLNSGIAFPDRERRAFAELEKWDLGRHHPRCWAVALQSGAVLPTDSPSTKRRQSDWNDGA